MFEELQSERSQLPGVREVYVQLRLHSKPSKFRGAKRVEQNIFVVLGIFLTPLHSALDRSLRGRADRFRKNHIVTRLKTNTGLFPDLHTLQTCIHREGHEELLAHRLSSRFSFL